jgi:hypothetical protein
MPLTRSNMTRDWTETSTVPGRTRWREKLEDKDDLDDALDDLRRKLSNMPDGASYHVVLTVEKDEE